MTKEGRDHIQGIMLIVVSHSKIYISLKLIYVFLFPFFLLSCYFVAAPPKRKILRRLKSNEKSQKQNFVKKESQKQNII